jgi:hypothetical protein
MTTTAAEQVALVLASTFAARLDAYAVWNGRMHVSACQEGCPECERRRRAADDEPTLPHIRAPLTPEVVLRGFLSDPARPVSGYMIAADSTTHVWAFDCDDEDGYAAARAIGQAAWEAGLPAYLEPSRRGAHLWGVLDLPLPAKTVRRGMRRVMQLASVAEHPKIEFRPAQDSIPTDGYGNSLRLPTMPHQATGKRGRLLHPATDEPIGPTLSTMLLAIEFGHAPQMAALAREFIPPFDPNAIPAGDRAPDGRSRNRNGAEEEDESISALLATHFGLQARPGKVVKCPAHDDNSPSLTVFPDDRRIICHSTGCEWYNNGHGLGTYQLRQIIGRQPVVEGPRE